MGKTSPGFLQRFVEGFTQNIVAAIFLGALASAIAFFGGALMGKLPFVLLGLAMLTWAFAVRWWFMRYMGRRLRELEIERTPLEQSMLVEPLNLPDASHGIFVDPSGRVARVIFAVRAVRLASFDVKPVLLSLSLRGWMAGVEAGAGRVIDRPLAGNHEEVELCVPWHAGSGGEIARVEVEGKVRVQGPWPVPNGDVPFQHSMYMKVQHG